MQCTSHVLMIRPGRFGPNPDTAGSNAFQRHAADPHLAHAAALAEFDAWAELLRGAGVIVNVIDDTPEPLTPDAIFPNNWFSCDSSGRVFLYPMEAPNRRLERRADVLAQLARRYRISEVTDLSACEQQGHYLEGTGSMVLDHEQKIAYACHSSRSHPAVMETFASQTGYRPYWFHAVDRDGRPIYHTNVMMAVGRSLAIVCLESVRDPVRRLALVASLRAGGKRVLAISMAQLEQFAGNMLELRSVSGEPLIAMSRRAWAALDADQQAVIAAHARPLLAPIDTIERLGGGSARCMIAEIFLPERGALSAALNADAVPQP